MEMEERQGGAAMAEEAGAPYPDTNGGGGAFLHSPSIPPLWHIPGMASLSPDLAMQSKQPIFESRPQMEDEGNHQKYPLPLVLHQDVITDEPLFLRTLAEFHLHFGSQLAVPRVPLDLHRLYCEVTSRGGLDKVVKENLWKQVAGCLNLPDIVSSPSYFLRKHYEDILYHYEQVYFKRLQGRPVQPPMPLPMPSNTSSSKQLPGPEIVFTRKRGREKFDQIQTNGVDPAVPLGHIVTGAIDGKFEHGYFVTVVVGSEKLRGVIYNVPPNQLENQQFSEVTELMNMVGKPLESSTDLRGSLRYIRKKKKQRDPNAPRPAKTAYNFFVSEQKRKQKFGKDEVSRTWNLLTLQEKMPYLQMAEQDKERFQKELHERQQQKQENPDFRPRENAEIFENGYRVTPSFLEPSYLSPEPLSYDVNHQLTQSSSQDDVYAQEGYG